MRLAQPHHAAAARPAIGNLFGTQEEAEKLRGLLVSRRRPVRGLGRRHHRLRREPDPAGLRSVRRGARTAGIWRRPDCIERVGMYAPACAAGACATAQLVIQGGMPAAFAGAERPLVNLVPHALTVDEIPLVRPGVRLLGAPGAARRLDGVEIHANHATT